MRVGGGCGEVRGNGNLRQGWRCAGRGLTTEFCFAFPIMCVDRLCFGSHAREGKGFPSMGDLILDLVWKSKIEEVPECTISITMNLGGQAIKVNDIHVDMFIVLHQQMTELLLYITDRVVGTEICLEFQNELGVAVHPEGTGSGG